MPQYRVISDVDSLAEYRSSRGESERFLRARRMTVVDAPSISHALARACDHPDDDCSHHDRRIVSIEELFPQLSLTDDQITLAITPMVAQQGYPHQPLFERDDFVWYVVHVADALRNAEIIPGLCVDVIHPEYHLDHFHLSHEHYVCVGVFDDIRGIMYSTIVEIEDLSDDYTATGWDGILAIARRLIAIANALL